MTPRENSKERPHGGEFALIDENGELTGASIFADEVNGPEDDAWHAAMQEMKHKKEAPLGQVTKIISVYRDDVQKAYSAENDPEFEQKHHRGGNPENPGQFSKNPGPKKTPSPKIEPQYSPAFQAELDRRQKAEASAAATPVSDNWLTSQGAPVTQKHIDRLKNLLAATSKGRGRTEEIDPMGGFRQARQTHDRYSGEIRLSHDHKNKMYTAAFFDHGQKIGDVGKGVTQDKARQSLLANMKVTPVPEPAPKPAPKAPKQPAKAPVVEAAQDAAAEAVAPKKKRSINLPSMPPPANVPVTEPPAAPAAKKPSKKPPVTAPPAAQQDVAQPDAQQTAAQPAAPGQFITSPAKALAAVKNNPIPKVKAKKGLADPINPKNSYIGPRGTISVSDASDLLSYVNAKSEKTKLSSLPGDNVIAQPLAVGVTRNAMDAAKSEKDKPYTSIFATRGGTEATHIPMIGDAANSGEYEKGPAGSRPAELSEDFAMMYIRPDHIVAALDAVGNDERGAEPTEDQKMRRMSIAIRQLRERGLPESVPIVVRRVLSDGGGPENIVDMSKKIEKRKKTKWIKVF